MMQQHLDSEERHQDEHIRREHEDTRRCEDEKIRRDEERLWRDEMRQNQQMFHYVATQHQSNSTLPGNQNRTLGVTADLVDDDVSNSGDVKDRETNTDAH